jgi:hypothetical protein
VSTAAPSPAPTLVRPPRAPGTVIACALTDVMMADLAVSVVFFYDRALDSGALEAGLAAALDHLPPFAGRLRTTGDRLELVCDGSGAAWAEADLPLTLAEAMARVTLPTSGLVDHVDAPAARGGTTPLLNVRVSALADGGTALGISFHHAVGDMGTFMMLLRSWSALTAGTPPPQAIVVPDRGAYLDSVLPARDQGRPGIRLMSDDEAADLRRDLESAMLSGRVVQIYFTDDEAAAMRDELSADAGQRLSITDVLTAFVVTTVRDLDADAESRNLAVAVDIRRRLDLPAEVIGNLTNELYLSCPPGGAPGPLAARLRAGIEDFTRSHLSIRSSHELLDTIGWSRLRDCVPVGFDLRNRTFSFSSWSLFGLYDTTFGGAPPVFFSPSPALLLPWTSWLVEGFGGHGHLYTVVLPARLAAKLRGADGRAALHRFRDADAGLPALAATARKVI